jgi:hypothetical protein
MHCHKITAKLYQHFGGTFCFHIHGRRAELLKIVSSNLKIVIAGSLETTVAIYQTT